MSVNVTNDHPKNPRVIMWCVPRSVSTAMTKCMSFVEGAEVWLESYVISKAASDIHELFHPDDIFPLEIEGNEEVYAEAAKNLTLAGDDGSKNEFLSPVWLKKSFDNIDPDKKFVFVKDMAVGMPPSRYEFLPERSSGFKHFFLIRNPVKVYKSLRKGMLDFIDTADPATLPKGFKIPDPENRETFHLIDDVPQAKDGTPYVYVAIHELWRYIKETLDDHPIVLDIDEMLENPSAMLPRLCGALGIPYTESLLTWDASTDVVRKWKSSCLNIPDSPRYAMWFTNAFKSTCFKASSTTDSLDDATNDIKEIVEKEMPLYREMHKDRITA